MAKIYFDFDPEEIAGVKLSRGRRADMQDAVADYVKESVLSSVGAGESPVSGGKWKRELSKAYAKEKGKVSSVKFSNMELHGDLLDSVDVLQKGKKLRLTVGEDQMDKADGHNNFSGKSKLPPREFVPNAKRGQTFKRDIISGIKKIVSEFEDEDTSDIGVVPPKRLGPGRDGG